MSWIGFFVSFVSTFAAAPMVAIIREDLELTKPDLGSAGLAAVTGTIAARVIMGSICDVVGPRYGLSIVLMVTAPFCFCMSYVTSAAGFLICRLGIGLGLATFVACQYLDVLHVQRQVCWNRKRHCCWMGQPWWRCHSVPHASYLPRHARRH